MAPMEDIELHENDRTYLTARDGNNSLRSPISIRVTSADFSDDGFSTALSSPVLPPESCHSPSPLLTRSDPNISPPTEPPPSFNPPAYRSIAYPYLPRYTPRGDKYSRLQDLESNHTHDQLYFRLPQYGWRIWSIVVIIVVVTVVTIVVALTRTIGNGGSSS
jgi:hypothetical protein